MIAIIYRLRPMLRLPPLLLITMSLGLAACAESGGVPELTLRPTVTFAPTGTVHPRPTMTPAPSPTPGWNGRPAEVVRIGNQTGRMVAFSFDAGSDAGYAVQILDTLRANGITA